jgi:hypothetical protein
MESSSPSPARLIMGFDGQGTSRPQPRAPPRRKSSLLSLHLGTSAVAREGSCPGMPSVDSFGDLSSVAEGEQQARSLESEAGSEEAQALHFEEAGSPSEHGISAALPIPYTR